jgi:hypothetical protein
MPKAASRITTKSMIGKRFGRLVVLKQAGTRYAPYGTRLLVLCRCDCGKKKTIIAVAVRIGLTKSCGCLQKEVLSKRRTSHGETVDGRTAEYTSWKAMRQRCYSPNYTKFMDYGGRGITVCERWNDFANFLADMGRKPSKRHSLDRIDNDGPYSQENCRWGTKRQQSRNRRKWVMIDKVIHGDIMTVRWRRIIYVPAISTRNRAPNVLDSA